MMVPLGGTPRPHSSGALEAAPPNASGRTCPAQEWSWRPRAWRVAHSRRERRFTRAVRPSPPPAQRTRSGTGPLHPVL